MASPSEGATKKCVLHVDEQKVSADAEIILFQESTLKMCQDAQKVHLARTRSKFKAITLPLIPNEVLGYHSRCYKDFTLLCQPKRNLRLLRMLAKSRHNLQAARNLL